MVEANRGSGDRLGREPVRVSGPQVTPEVKDFLTAALLLQTEGSTVGQVVDTRLIERLP